MAILPTLVEARNITRTVGDLSVLDDFWYGVTGGPSKAGVTVSEKTSLRYITVARCVMLISADLARLPLILYRNLPGGGKEQVVDHPLYDILKNLPNPETNSFQWRESGNGHVELWGNHYSVIQRHRLTGDIKALWQIENPGPVKVRRGKNGRIYYEWYGRIYPSGQTTSGVEIVSDPGEVSSSTLIRIPAENMFHVPGFSFNGLYGLSVIGSMIRESVGLGLANDEFAARYFGQGMNIGAVMNVPQDLGDGKEAYLKELRKQHAGLMNSHGILLTQNDETYTQLKMPLKDAQFIEGRRFQKTEIAGFFGVPPHKLAIHEKNANRSNLEQENQNYVDSCLIHRTTRFESAISQQLLTKKERQAGLFAEFNIAGLLRGDSKARAEYYNKMFQIAGITPNQIAMKENMNPIGPEGDKHFVMLNLVPLDQAGDMGAQPGANSIRMIEHRSILARERISRQYHPLIKRAADKIVTLEAKAITRNADKFSKQRAKADMERWLNDFYSDMPEKIKREIGPVFQSFSEAIIAESIAEIGADPEKVDLDIFVRDYIDGYADRHSSSSLGQMVALLDGELDGLTERAGEWEERRPDKIANNETVRLNNATFQAVAFAVGLSTVWRARGAETCPYCMELNGRRVASGQSFVADGDEIDPTKGTGPMLIRGMKAHPPLHQGCDCYLAVT